MSKPYLQLATKDDNNIIALPLKPKLKRGHPLKQCDLSPLTTSNNKDSVFSLKLKRAKIQEESNEDILAQLKTSAKPKEYPLAVTPPTDNKIADFLKELYCAGFHITLIANFILNNAFSLVDIIEGNEIKYNYSNLVKRIKNARYSDIFYHAQVLFVGINKLPLYNYILLAINREQMWAVKQAIT